MPRYYFYLERGECRVPAENDAMALPDEEAAWYQAYRCAARLAEPAGAVSTPSSYLTVEDEEGHPVMALAFDNLVRHAV